MNLKELYESGNDIKDSDIPEIWKKSFNEFIMCQTCQVESDEDGKFIQFIYYACDFRVWYFKNKQAIERDIKIDNIIEND